MKPQLEEIFISVTNRCNLNCFHCYASAGSSYENGELSKEELINIVDEAGKLGVKEFNITGGEPFIREDIFDILDQLDFWGIRFNLSTGGTLITPRILNKLRKYKHCECTQVSVDGPEEYHDYMRGRKGSFRRALRAIKLFKSEGLPIMVNSVLHRENLPYLEFFSDLSLESDIFVRLTLLNPMLGRARERENIVLSPREIQQAVRFVNFKRKHNIKIAINLPPILLPLEDIQSVGRTACGWPNFMCGILPNGDVTICPLASEHKALVAGNLKINSFQDIWYGNLFKELRNYDVRELKGVCGKCIIREKCGGGCRLAAYLCYGDFLAPYPMCQDFYDQDMINKLYLRE